MKRKFKALLPVIASILILAFSTANLQAQAVFAQAADSTDPVYKAKVDSLKNHYISRGVSVKNAEYRAKTVIAQQHPAPGGIAPRSGFMKPVPSQGSIHVNRNPTYENYTPTQLVEEIFVRGGACSSVSNVSLISHGWNGTNWIDNGPTILNEYNRGLGYFSRGTSNFEFNEGLVLSTGGLVSIEGPNDDLGAVFGPIYFDPNSDPDLAAIVAPRIIANATVLEFDFVPIGNTMVFRYVFASEEYLNYVNSEFNDVFGFFIERVGFPATKANIALLPNGQPVSINNVNWGYKDEEGDQWAHNCVKPGNYGTNPSNPEFYINIPDEAGGDACLDANRR